MSEPPSNPASDSGPPSALPPASPFTPLAERRREPFTAHRADELFTARLYWFLAFLLALLILRFFVPYMVEHLQYALTRGRQRAEVEAATEGLADFPLESLSKAYQLVSQRVGPSVVHITVVSFDRDARADEFSNLFGSPLRRGEGSGVVIDTDGHILTNNHVVRAASRIQVTMSDGRVLTARVVGVDAATDLAVLKVSGQDFIAAEWGESNALEVGALVWAVGSPFGLQQTITFGILSAKNRENLSNSAYLNFLQTDAAVNPGNSGGPLVDVRGRVIGINTAIVGESYQGISFAIPSSVARRVYEKLKTNGHVVRGWLGVSLQSVDQQVAEQLQLPVQQGALVLDVFSAPDIPAPALAAGIEHGDVIIRWNGQPIKDALSLQRLVALTEVGQQVEVVVIREGNELSLQVLVGERPANLN